jgi:hypothetical protein
MYFLIEHKVLGAIGAPPSSYPGGWVRTSAERPDASTAGAPARQRFPCGRVRHWRGDGCTKMHKSESKPGLNSARDRLATHPQPPIAVGNQCTKMHKRRTQAAVYRTKPLFLCNPSATNHLCSIARSHFQPKIVPASFTPCTKMHNAPFGARPTICRPTIANPRSPPRQRSDSISVL